MRTQLESVQDRTSPRIIARALIEAFQAANKCGLTTVLLSGNTGGSAKGMCTRDIIVPSNDRARIQEVHTVVLHQWLEFIDKEFVDT